MDIASTGDRYTIMAATGDTRFRATFLGRSGCRILGPLSGLEMGFRRWSKLHTPGWAAAAFPAAAAIPSAERRALEAVGNLRPRRTDSGWRTFDADDVAAALTWK